MTRYEWRLPDGRYLQVKIENQLTDELIGKLNNLLFIDAQVLGASFMDDKLAELEAKSKHGHDPETCWICREQKRREATA